MNILLIEPNGLLAEQYQDILSKAGHKVTHVTDAQSAIVQADKNSPQAVIIEPLLSSHSGIEFIYEFRTYSDWQKLPIIVLSRVDSSRLGLTDKICRDLGVSYLYKPETTTAKLIKAVEASINETA